MDVGIRDAKNRRSELVDAMLSGEQVFLTNRGSRVAQLVAADKPATGRRGRGFLEEKIKFCPGWDSPEEDRKIQKMFEAFAEMRVLPDTNAFLRWPGGKTFPRAANLVLSRHTTERAVSIVTAWEIAIKPSLGLEPADVEAGIGAMGGKLLSIRFAHLTELSALPIAHAISEGLAIVSSDTRFPDKKLRVVWD